MKFNIPEDQVEDFQNLLLNGKIKYVYLLMYIPYAEFMFISALLLQAIKRSFIR